MATLDDQLTDDIASERGRRKKQVEDPSFEQPGNTVIQQTPGNIDPESGLVFNTPEWVAWVNKAHPEYGADGGKPATTTAQPNYGWLSGYDVDKVSNQSNSSYGHAKSAFGRTLAMFDPRMGFTPEVIAAMNKLGYGTFSGSGQNLSLHGLTDAGRAAGLERDYDNRDFIRDYTGAGGPGTGTQTAWTYDPGYDVVDTPTGTPANIPIPTGGSNNPNPGAGGGGGNIPAPTQPPADPGAGNGTGLEDLLKKLIEDQEKRRAADEEYRKKIHDTVTHQIDDANTPVDPNDPIIAAQMRAYRGNQDRSMASAREALAARGATTGLGTGAFDSAIQSSYENAGSSAGAQESGLLADRYKQKLQQLESALQTGAGVLSNDESIDLQTKIAAIKTRLDKLGLDQAGQLGNRGLDIQQMIAQLENQLGNRRLDQDNSHFYDTLGFNIGNQQATLEQILMSMLLGGR